MELLKTHSVKAVQETIMSLCSSMTLHSEEVPLPDSLHRILSTPVTSPHDVPEFHRSTVDGYALNAQDTFGASEAMPAMLTLKGEVHMGTQASVIIAPGECAYVPTGGMLPEGADAMVMVEYVEALDQNTLLIQQPVSPGANILHKGEDLQRQEIIFEKGHRLRPQDLGLLAGMGFQNIPVAVPPRVAVISTGDELISPEDPLSPGKIIDMNTYSLSAALREDGYQLSGTAVVKDNLDILQKTIHSFMDKADIILISGGSSMGEYDITKKAIDGMGEPGAVIHGMSVKPGKPTIVGMAEGVLMLGLPGQPVSALVVYHLLMKPLFQYLTDAHVITPVLTGELTVNVPSAPGREHYVMVTLLTENGKILVTPQHGKSGMLSMMGRAQGMIKMDVNQEGLTKGTPVEVILF
ncbi:MAG: molybdopterin molybdotransferase MoeA [Bacillota bacterium]|nr:molybdopterin molybdotransferase MoeA [Bacillota bacterium]MDW7677418.1 molybdopterin molybdotransferase MoeA [Bacillota bacterium]